jgi:signal peptidase II
MLCFVFAALIVLLDQFFKRWIVLTLGAGGETVIIPGIMSLIYVENTGAAFSILAGQRWLLAGIAFIAIIVLVFILLRYNEGFWGTLGLASVLGGAVGNLIDRVFHGYVIDMFRTLLFPNFAIFNIADIFITLGGITFCIFFIISSFKSTKREEKYSEDEQDEYAGYAEDPYGVYDLSNEQDVPDYDQYTDTRTIPTRYHEQDYSTPPPVYNRPGPEQPVYEPEPIYEPESVYEPLSVYEPEPVYQSEPVYETQISDDITSTLKALESELADIGTVEDRDLDDLLREYGFEDDKA